MKKEGETQCCGPYSVYDNCVGIYIENKSTGIEKISCPYLLDEQKCNNYCGKPREFSGLQKCIHT